MLTEEQKDIVNEVCNSKDDRIITVNAIAGSGKTATSFEIIKKYAPNNGFYTAFNKSVVDSGKNKFGNLIECKTLHSLAYNYIPRNILKNRNKIKELNYTDLDKHLTYDEKLHIIDYFDNFCRSKYLDISEYCKEHISDISNIKDYISDIIDKMLNGELSPSFNFILKLLHSLLDSKDIIINKDLLILDEAQDTTAVALEIFKLINADKKIVLGDKFQNIYSFMNTVNAFELLKDTNNFKLTKSFRCNPYIANKVENYGKMYLEEDFKYKGNEDLKQSDTTITYLFRTNSALIKQMYELLQDNKSFSIIRNLNEIFALPLALEQISEGNRVYGSKNRYLQLEYNLYCAKERKPSKIGFFRYLEEILPEQDAAISAINLIKFVNDRGTKVNIIKDKVNNMLPNKNIILSTAHTFKGLEADRIILNEDLNKFVSEVTNKIYINKQLNSEDSLSDIKRKELNTDDINELNLYYVAMSRAKHYLENSKY